MRDPLSADLIAELAGATGAWSPSLSPDGTRVAYVTDRSGLPRLEVAPLDGSAAPRRLSLPDQEVVSVAWSPHWAAPAPVGEWLAYLVAPDGLIRSELHAVRPDGTDRLVLAGEAETETVFAGCWTPVAGRYAFSLAAGAGARPHLVDVIAGTVEPVGAEDGFQIVTSVAPDGRRLVIRRGERARRHLVLLDLDAGTSRRLVPRDLAGGVPMDGEDGRFSPDGRSIYLRTSAGEEFTVLAQVPLDEAGAPGELRILARRPGTDLDGYAVLPDGERAVCVWNDGGASVVELVDLRGGAVLEPVPLPHEVVTAWSLAADARTFVAALSGPRHPRRLWQVGLPGAARPLAITPPDAAPAVAPTRLHLAAADGSPLDAWLYRPVPGAGPDGPPRVVVTFHGGPESQERPSYSGPTQALVAAGLTVVAPNVRGSSGFGRTFVGADDGERRLAAIEDVCAVVDHLVAEGIAVPGRIGAHGWSYGGYLTLIALCRWPTLFAAGCSVAGMSDLRTFFSGTEPWMAAASTAEYGDPATQPDLLRELSPTTHVDRLVAPTLFVHGDRDTNVPVEESVQAHRALRDRGIPAELVLLPGEGHAIVGRAGRVRLAQEVTSWFDRWL